MNKIKSLIKNSFLFPFAVRLFNIYIDIEDFACSSTGYILSHNIRLFIYRHIFRIKIGKGSYIHFGCRFYNPKGITIGDNCVIGHRCFLDGRRNITIGNNVNIAGETHIYTLQHNPQCPLFSTVGGPVNIEDYVFTGTRTMILPNVTVAEGAGIAAGAVVTKNVEPYTIVGGVPAKYIQDRNRDLEYTLKCARLFH